MREFLENKKGAMRDWAVKHAEGPQAQFWLGFVAFVEASFFPLPPSTLLVAILLANKAQRWAYYAFLTTLFSVLGGVFGYIIGIALFDFIGEHIISLYGLEAQFHAVGESFNAHAFLTIFTAAFTPIPYKVFTIAAGVFHINIFTFIVASILGRGARYFAMAYLVKKFGKHVSAFLDRYFALATFLIVIFLVLLVYFLV